MRHTCLGWPHTGIAWQSHLKIPVAARWLSQLYEFEVHAQYNASYKTQLWGQTGERSDSSVEHHSSIRKAARAIYEISLKKSSTAELDRDTAPHNRTRFVLQNVYHDQMGAESKAVSENQNNVHDCGNKGKNNVMVFPFVVLALQNPSHSPAVSLVYVSWKTDKQ